MAYSPALSSAVLSDYLAPSAICIKPVSTTPAPTEPTKPTARAKRSIELDSAPPRPPQKAEITLNDCLACSGCITTAESVLVNLQSHNQVYKILEEEPNKTKFAIISPASLASLAAYYNLPIPHVFYSIRLFFKSVLGFSALWDDSFANQLASILEQSEMQSIWSQDVEKSTQNQCAKRWWSQSPSKSQPVYPLPIISSSCPGTICYLEKTHPPLLPFVSRVMSPQQITGVLLKGPSGVASTLGVSPHDVYTVSVMMCADKKLEASRPVFGDEGSDGRDVDCVLTTGELVKMMEREQWDIRAMSIFASNSDSTRLPSHSPATKALTEDSFFPSLVPPTSSLSSPAAHIENALRYFLSTLSKEELSTCRIERVGASKSKSPRGRTRPAPNVNLESSRPGTLAGEDWEEISIWMDSPHISGVNIQSTQIFKAAKCYGFKNMMNLVRNMGPTIKAAELRLGNEAKGTRAMNSLSVGEDTAPGAGARKALAARARAKARLNSSLVTPAKEAPEVSEGSGPERIEKPTFDYIELMACPSGCINGGGQLAPPSNQVKAESSSVKLDEEGLPLPQTLLDKLSPDEWGYNSEWRGIPTWDGGPPKAWIERVMRIFYTLQNTSHVVSTEGHDGTLTFSLEPPSSNGSGVALNPNPASVLTHSNGNSSTPPSLDVYLAPLIKSEKAHEVIEQFGKWGGRFGFHTTYSALERSEADLGLGVVW